MRMRHSDTRLADRFGEREYRRLRRATRTYREELVLRLGAEVGLRSTEMARIRPADVTHHVYRGRTHHFLTVPDEEGATARRAYVPGDVRHDLGQFVRVNGIDDDERVLPVTPRRIQMLVSEVGERAADGPNDVLSEVSSRALRQYFARQLLVEEEVHPRVVQAVGGWDRMESLTRHLDEPDVAEVAAAFEGGAPSAGGDGTTPAAFRQAVENTTHVVYVTDEEGVIEYVNPRFEEVTGYDESEAVGRSARVLASDHDESERIERWETITDGETWEGRLRNERKDGEAYRVEQTVTPVTADDGTVERFVVVGTLQGGGATPGDAVSSARYAEVFESCRTAHERILDASTRTETERIACERMAACDAYRFAWLGDITADRHEVRAHAGLDAGAIESLAVAEGASTAAVRTGEVQVSADVREDSAFAAWRDHARDHDYRAAAAIPVVDGETTHGVLHLAADARMSDRERALLADFGERVGQAITVAKQQKLLLADTVTRVEFTCTDPDSFFVRASAEHGCTFRLEGVVPGEDQSLLYFVTMEGASNDDVLRWAADADALADARLVRDYDDESLFEFVLTGTDCSKSLAKRGATVREMSATDGAQRVVGEVATDADIRGLVDVLTTVYPDSELASKQEIERTATQTTTFRTSLSEDLTEKQATVLRAAHHAGYFEWPRGSTAEELADSLGVASPTLHNHLRRAQQKLLAAFLEDDPSDPRWGNSPWTDT